eukprot:TRINITY_DN17288_c0_g1_i1.p1 TRINITY_DN17288_c0_g1~~TRINITY_DN17288_c0_g1_i1.p1  ORF type:complete len:798 (-),score=164.69 TRINITY_DN17288_c0_g1_i1:330-2723(-)
MRENATIAAGGCGCCCLGWIIFFIVLGTSVKNITDQQQVVYISGQGKTVENGPFSKVIWPSTRHEVRDAVRISYKEYAVLKHERKQTLRHVPGPALVFPDAYEQLVGVRDQIILTKREYVRLEDEQTGVERVIGGPGIIVPNPLEKAPKGVEQCIVVGATNGILVENKTSGMQKLISQSSTLSGKYKMQVQAPDGTLGVVTVSGLQNGVAADGHAATWGSGGFWNCPTSACDLYVVPTGDKYAIQAQAPDGTRSTLSVSGLTSGSSTGMPASFKYDSCSGLACEFNITAVGAGSYAIEAVAADGTRGTLSVWNLQHGATDGLEVKWYRGDYSTCPPPSCTFFIATQNAMFVPQPYEHIKGQQQATLLDPLMYAVVKDKLSGKPRNELGPKLLHIGPYEELLSVNKKWVLEKDEYIRLLNKKTGAERVLQGPAVVVPDPSEEAPEGKNRSVYVDQQTAVRVENRVDGQQRLSTQAGVFAPSEYERIKEVQTLIRVLPSQACVTRDVNGSVNLISGALGGRAFFLPPFTHLVEFTWSAYKTPSPKEPVPKEKFSMIDLRMQKMFFSNEVRTSDNVKLKLEGTIFWQVKDVLQMMSLSSDAPGDVSQRTRSALTQAVSSTTLQTFMESFNNITQRASQAQSGDTFYSSRGVELLSIEITGYEAVDNQTKKVLQDIIKQTTKRINDLQKQKSENDVAAAKLEANITLEKRKTELIRTKADNARLEAQGRGQSEGEQLAQTAATFIQGLNTSLPNVTTRVNLYKLQQVMKARNKDTANLAAGKSQLFMTTEDINLNLASTGT